MGKKYRKVSNDASDWTWKNDVSVEKESKPIITNEELDKLLKVNGVSNFAKLSREKKIKKLNDMGVNYGS